MRGVALLGCTGSIGRSALQVLERHRDAFRIVALAAHRNDGELAAQCARHRPDLAVLADDDAVVNGKYGSTRIEVGRAALLAAAAHPDADIVINAVVGAAGLEATLVALRAGKRLALANKESLVAGGPLVLEALRQGGGALIPIDSEHSAILQCLDGASPGTVRRLILTASGGPFRGWTRSALQGVTRAEALRHPTWAMGEKITIDSATLANKALEVIEARFLYDIDYDDIDVVVHPQSIIHSMVEFIDGSMLAQLGFPTMELPILYALTHPARAHDTSVRPFNPVEAGTLTFEAVDDDAFPTFRLGVEAGRAGGTAPAVFNAANEVAVASFLDGGCTFMNIPSIIEGVLARHVPRAVDSLDTVRAADAEARESAHMELSKSC